MFKKILVANRGEIAQRILIACRHLDIASVVLFSEADRDANWLPLADESYPLKGVSATETYLNQNAILRIASQCQADAIHPGYGFLSENADFAEACREHGIVFIGPDPEAMRALGNKAEARALAIRAGVPVIPGVSGSALTDIELEQAAASLGYPVLIKASAGGGGRGMRVVDSPSELGASLQAARAEALSAFGDDHVLIEKYFQQVHHVEVQVIGDNHDQLLHLFERECSIQRRHQKIIEESPAPVLHLLRDGGDLSNRMTSAAVALCHAAGYVNAGTVEFVLDRSPNGTNSFFFLEMNTRLQVEHPVTEMVTGVDLVCWQIRVAAGEPLPLKQEEITRRGHAIECRIYAEDPAKMFLPSTGKINTYRPPSGPAVRVDSGITAGSVVTPYYDSMLAKIITWGSDRGDAIRRMVQALKETVILGVTTNIPYLLDILADSCFLDGRTNTSFLQKHMSSWVPKEPAGEEAWLAAAVLEQLSGGRIPAGTGSQSFDALDPWSDSSKWRNAP